MPKTKPTHAFVDGISETPTILMDLDEAPFQTAAFLVPPPTLRRSVVGSTSRDGDTIAQDSYNDRVITIRLNAFTSTAEHHLEKIQQLGRLLNAGGQWLMYQQKGAAEPTFYRTKRADYDITELLVTDSPKRTVTVNIPAEPFAYGPAVSGTATVVNDPTAADNPMSIVMPPIKGDVATGLTVKIPNEIGTISDGDAVSVLATHAGESVPASPYWVDFSDISLYPNSPGWSRSIESSSSAIGGTFLRYVFASGGFVTYSQTVTGAVNPECPPGDYRIYARMRASVPTEATISSTDAEATVTHNLFTYVDMGVARVPLRSPLDSGIGPMALPDVDPLLEFRLFISASGQVDLDGLLFVPAGIDTDVDTRIALIRRRVKTGYPMSIVLDSDRRQLYNLRDGENEYAAGASLDGADRLVVVPGYENFLSFIRLSTPVSASPAFSGDNPATLTDIEWAYFPRYLYTRSALS